MQLAFGHGAADRRLQNLEDLGAQRVVLLLALVEEVADVEEDQAVDVRLGHELGLEGAQAIDEDEGVAGGEQFLQGVLPALAAIHAEVVRRGVPQPSPPQLTPQGSAQGFLHRREPLRVRFSPRSNERTNSVKTRPPAASSPSPQESPAIFKMPPI